MEPPRPSALEQKPELISQADSIIRGLQELRKFEFSWSDSDPVLTATSLHQLRLEKDGLCWLESSLLPQLQRQCASLSGALRDPSHLREDAASTLKFILEIQTNLAQILYKTIGVLDGIFPGKIPEPHETNDQHFGELKIYRLYSFNKSFREDVKNHLNKLFHEFIFILEEFKLSRETSLNFIKYLLFDSDQAFDRTIGFLKGSELSFIWDLWEKVIPQYDLEFEGLSIQMGPMRYYEAEINPLSRPVIDLGTPFMAIFKLSRSFFKKLCRERINKEELELFTEMCSDQLFSFNRSTRGVYESLSNLKFAIGHADEYDRINTSSTLLEELQNLKSYFQNFLYLINLYILPNLFPKLTDFPSKIYFQNWFVTWNTSFLTVTHEAIRLAKAFQES
ncbi:hypothetical protein PGT21_009584 [Puccinia graminis f. sp. tritici]|uniref:Uncharacterized protein n=2 Tax=Puccinia graminis f. sp. tritici TaxID=56615 RepID=E3KSB1_PUCGT|nr:uncharacterized protein PGTG_13405 [Puccinia graminis f. sp. tritici CRL 75-36-700-3]EFP87186.1 hypothetical protein PGTG_13405 [Puccinia graminis f. sp. tritici CRL 75-36-700-3]KAA1073349.1 hypothetical protein PGT21_009584 [Puccinia graminis f. sp. tritici]